MSTVYETWCNSIVPDGLIVYDGCAKNAINTPKESSCKKMLREKIKY